jgi:5-methylcytosine-specific restriction endonuclease McrA
VEIRKLKTKGKEFTYILENNILVSRTCATCGVVKDVTNFYKSSKRYLGYYPSCKPCQSQTENSRYKSKSSEYSSRNKKYYEKNKETIKKQTASWRKNNSVKYNEYMYVRDRDKRQKALTSEFFAEMQLKHEECRKLSEASGIKYEVDHIIPLKGKNVSGLHVPWNVQFLTKSENCQKSNKWDGTYDNTSWKKV